jgi:hypothetical protein
MSFSSHPSSNPHIRAAIEDADLDCLSVPPSPRAGVRARSSRHEPPALFAAVETAVLVVVTCLAMVAVILTASDDASAAPARSAFSRNAVHIVAAPGSGSR